MALEAVDGCAVDCGLCAEVPTRRWLWRNTILGQLQVIGAGSWKLVRRSVRFWARDDVRMGR